MTEIEFRSAMTVKLIEFVGSDQSAVRAARVSTVGENEGENGDKLVAYLIREGHWSPFMHTSFTVLVECDIPTARQVFKHTVGVVFNETSGRYSELKPVFHIPAPERPLVQSGKVGHYTFEPGDATQSLMASEMRKDAARFCWDLYQYQLDAGIAKEVARNVLPLSLYTSFYMTLNARSLMHFLDLRQHSTAQYEIQEIAAGLEKILEEKMPLTHAAWREYSGHNTNEKEES